MARLISATDPIAVVAIFKNLGVPKRLAVLLEGESLLNDGTAIVFFTLSLALVTGTVVTAGGLAFDFIKIVGIGALIGTGVGLAVSQVIKQVDDPMIEITLTTIAAYGSFLAAEHFHYSGVIATVSAGMLCGNYGARVGMSPSTRIAVETFWEYVAFALNSIVFLLIGLEVHFQALLASWQAILVAYLVVTGGRALVIFGASSLLRRTRERIPWAWSVILTWGGLRGALPMVLVLSLPEGFSASGIAGLDDLRGRHSFDPCPRIDDVAPAAMAGHCARTPGTRRVRIDARQVAGSPCRVGGDRPECRTSISPIRRCSPVSAANMSKRLSAIVQRWMNCISRNSNFTPRNYNGRGGTCCSVEKGVVIDAFHHGGLSQDVQEKLLADIDGQLLHLESGEADTFTDSADGVNSAEGRAGK